MTQNNKLFVNTAFLYILIKIVGTLFALHVFNHFTPLVDSKLYIDGYYINDGNFRTELIQKITTLIVELSNPLLTHTIFSLFSGIGIFILSYTMKNKFILLLLLFPSALIWTSIVGKEAIYYGCFTLILAVWSMQISNVKARKGFVLHMMTSILLAVCLILRPHYTIPLIYLLSTCFVFYTFDSKKIQLILIAIILVCTASLISYLFIMPENLIARGYGAVDETARASRFAYYNIDLLNPHLIYTKGLLFRDGIFGIIGPFPSELLIRLEFIPFFIEGITILLFPIAIGCMFKDTKNVQIYKKYFYYALVPAILMSIIIHAPFGILNPGTAIRWRVNFELIFYLAPILIYMKSKNG